MDVNADRLSIHRGDWFSNHNVEKLEKTLSRGHCVAFNSVQSAVQACLELLGSRVAELPVVMPVTAGPDELAAVLRAGGSPLLVDISEKTLQLDPEKLKEILKVLEEEELVPVVLVDKIDGTVDQDILDQIQNLPSIGVYRGELNTGMTQEYFSCAFNVVDTTTIAGSGAIIFHSYPTQVDHLRLIRSGIMGMNANMPEGVAGRILLLLDNQIDLESYEEIKKKYLDSGLEILPPSKYPATIWVKVKDAKLTSVQLNSYGIEAPVALYPLHDLEEVKKRFQQDPDYPAADKVKNQYICVPTHLMARDKTDKIIEIIGEINE